MKENTMHPAIEEAIEFLHSWDAEPTTENIKEVMKDWIRNLSSHLGNEAHDHMVSCGISLGEGWSWEEHDRQTLSQISEYTQCLLMLG